MTSVADSGGNPVVSGWAVIQELAAIRQGCCQWAHRSDAFANSISKILSSGYNRHMSNLTAAILLLTTCLTTVAQKLPTVAVLATGGTIASKHDPAKGGYSPALSGEDLVSAVPAIRKIAQIQVEQISNIGSQDMTPEIWVRLAGRVNELLARPEIAGIVVTHGTDTLEETAYFLDLTTISTKPVILVGAQRPASDPDSDGPRNLLIALSSPP
jgi:L-asparaginase